MQKSNGAFRTAHFTEVVRTSKGPLGKVPLYYGLELSIATQYAKNRDYCVEVTA